MHASELFIRLFAFREKPEGVVLRKRRNFLMKKNRWIVVLLVLLFCLPVLTSSGFAESDRDYRAEFNAMDLGELESVSQILA